MASNVTKSDGLQPLVSAQKADLLGCVKITLKQTLLAYGDLTSILTLLGERQFIKSGVVLRHIE